MNSQFQKRLSDIVARYPVEFAYLFGSYATGDTGLLSDIDIALAIDASLAVDAREETVGDVRADIEREFDMRDKVDIVVVNQAGQELPPALERAILYDGALVYIKNDACASTTRPAPFVGGLIISRITTG